MSSLVSFSNFFQILFYLFSNHSVWIGIVSIFHFSVLCSAFCSTTMCCFQHSQIFHSLWKSLGLVCFHNIHFSSEMFGPLDFFFFLLIFSTMRQLLIMRIVTHLKKLIVFPPTHCLNGYKSVCCAFLRNCFFHLLTLKYSHFLHLS